MENNNEIFLGSGTFLNVKTSNTVELRDLLQLSDGDKTVQLDIRILADLNTIPPDYHEVFLNMLTTRYYGKASFGDNPFSKCLPKKPKRWWQFWKNNH